MRASLFFRLSAVLIGLSLLSSVQAATVHVTTELAPGGDVIQQGETTSVTVKAIVENALSANDGIFTFDLDLIIGLLSGGPQVLEVVSVSRPDVIDPLNGNGTNTPAGRELIYGEYAEEFRGLATPQVLFTVLLKGLDIGSASVVPAPSVEHFGFDFVLLQSADLNTVNYDLGVVIQVIPSPTSLMGGIILGLLLIGLRLRYTPPHAQLHRCWIGGSVYPVAPGRSECRRSSCIA